MAVPTYSPNRQGEDNLKTSRRGDKAQKDMAVLAFPRFCSVASRGGPEGGEKGTAKQSLSMEISFQDG